MTLISDEKQVVQYLIRQTERNLELEVNKVTSLLHDCKVDKVQPPKDYWHEQVKLQNKLKALRALLEII